MRPRRSALRDETGLRRPPVYLAMFPARRRRGGVWPAGLLLTLLLVAVWAATRF